MAVLTSSLARGIFLSVWLLALPSAAAQWHVISLHTDAGSTVSLDSASVSSKDYIANGWVRIEYQAPRMRDGQNLTGYVAQWQANCQSLTYWTTDSFGFRPKGQDSVRLYITSQEWQSPMPGSDEAVALTALCDDAKSWIDKAVDKAGELF